MILSGYSVLSLPENNFQIDSKIAFKRKAPIINGIYYSGYMRWGGFIDVDKLLRDGFLPEHIRNIILDIRNNRNLGLYNYGVIRSFKDAILLKNYLNSLGDRLEIIGLYSKLIGEILGSHEFVGKADFLGYDIDTDGYSAVLTCFFEKPELFKEEIKIMNQHGLLPNLEAVTTLIEKYLRIQDSENIEMIEKDKIDILSVYRLKD